MRALPALAVFLAAGVAHAQTPSSVSGLRLWVDAAAARTSSGERITTLTPNAGPILTGIGPILQNRAVGQAAAMRFQGTEMLRSSEAVAPGSSFTSTLAFRLDGVGRRMTLFQIGLLAPTGVRIGTDRRLELFSGTRSAKGTQPWSAGDSGVVTVVWSGSTAKLFVNGTLDATLSPGAAATTNGPLLVGARAVGQDGFFGRLVGFAYYGRALADSERRTVEAFYASPTDVALDATYVSTAGTPSANGLLPSDPLSSLSAAVVQRAVAGGQILVDAPSSRPVVGMVDIVSEAPLTIRGLNGVPWYMKTGTTLEGGWTRDADGAYSRAWTPRVFLAAYVPTLPDAKGRPTLLAPPYEGDPLAYGQLELANGRLRVRLPKDANPNLHTIEISRETSCLRIENGKGTLQLLNGVFRGGSQACVQVGQPDRGGNLVASDCVAEYGVCGFRGAGQLSSLTLSDCIARLNTNDGFSMKGYDGVLSVMRLSRCQGYENWEEGASPHNDSTIFADGCDFFDNGESGMMAINRARFEATDCRFLHNHLRRELDTEGGVAYAESAKGRLTKCTFEDNNGAGYYRVARSNVPISGLVSQRNTAKDR